MENNNLVKHSLIKKEDINPSQFTLSLLGEAYRLNILSLEETENIQMQIMSTLSERIMKFTRGESCSVKTETAENILLSIFYCIDAYLMSFDEADESIFTLQTKSIKNIYEEGLALAKTYANECRLLLAVVQQSKIDVELHAYNTTIDEGFSGCFDEYDADFSAHDTTANIDYPVLFDDATMCGISYVKQYLTKLNLENQFCGLLPISEINSLLNNYGSIYEFDYRDMLINIFQLVLSNSIFSLLLGNSAKKLSITKDECALLQDKLRPLNENDCYYLVEKAIEMIISELAITQPDLQNYMRKFKNALAKELMNYVKRSNLEKLIITTQSESIKTINIFEQGSKMDDDSFKDLVEEMLLCKSATDKFNIIKSDIQCLDDFIDILSADCIFDDEYTEIFSMLSDIELAMLVIKICENAPHIDILSASTDNMHLTQNEIVWQEKCISHLKSLSEDRIAEITKLSKSIQQ